MSNAELKIEFLAGTGIKEAITEAKQKAIDFDLAYVKFPFNDFHVSIGQSADIESAVKKYRDGVNPIIEA